jgi:hypothetical protein
LLKKIFCANSFCAPSTSPLPQIIAEECHGGGDELFRRQIPTNQVIVMPPPYSGGKSPVLFFVVGRVKRNRSKKERNIGEKGMAN